MAGAGDYFHAVGRRGRGLYNHPGSAGRGQGLYRQEYGGNILPGWANRVGLWDKGCVHIRQGAGYVKGRPGCACGAPEQDFSTHDADESVAVLWRRYREKLKLFHGAKRRSA